MTIRAVNNLVVVTVTTRNYLHRTRVLMESVRTFLPEAGRVACLIDNLQGDFVTSQEPFEIVPAASNVRYGYRKLSFALDATALCCALKPIVVKYASDVLGAERIIYVDNDMVFYRRPEELLRALDQSSFVLTPHVTRPLPPGARPNEAVILPYGVFNAGLFAVADSPDASAFIQWWGEKMLDPRNVRREWGSDQAWLAFAPVFVPGAGILRDVGYNVAAWNLPIHPVEPDADGSWRVGDAPLTAFHFSGFDEEQPSGLFIDNAASNYQATAAVKMLLADYSERLTLAGAASCRALGYGFAAFSDGTPITAADRNRLRTVYWDETPPEFDPFGLEGRNLLAPRRAGRLHRLAAQLALRTGAR